MKKLILLSALLIFACSSEDSNESQNNTSSKKLRSINILNPCIWCEVEFGDYEYTNGKLTSVDAGGFVTDENGDFVQGYPNEYLFLIEHLSNSIRINTDGYPEIYPTNSDGTFMSENIDFSEGYVQRVDDVYFSWSNGNLVEMIGSDGYVTEIVYSDFDDLTGHLGITIAAGGDFSFIIDNIFAITGLVGNSTEKLPYSLTTTGPDYTSQTIYTYLFDDDGYPIQVVRESNSSTFDNTRRFQFTYE